MPVHLNAERLSVVQQMRELIVGLGGGFLSFSPALVGDSGFFIEEDAQAA